MTGNGEHIVCVIEVDSNQDQISVSIIKGYLGNLEVKNIVNWKECNSSWDIIPSLKMIITHK